MVMQFEDVAFRNDMIPILKRKNVAAVRVAAGGAMGTPGETIIFFQDNDGIRRAHGNYVYGDTDLDKLSRALRLTMTGPKAWADIYMGAGHTLLVNQRDYPVIAESLQGKDEEGLWSSHEDVIWQALCEAVDRSSASRCHKPETDDLDDDFDDLGIPISVYLEPSQEQIQSKGFPKALKGDLPDHKRIYLREMDATPDELCVEKQTGWEKVICVTKEDFPRLMQIWYPNGAGAWDWQSLLKLIDGNKVWIHGWGD